ncbi:MAG: tyrosine-type recombinase/integrase [Thermoanaerobaculia bacterium]
MPLCSAHGTPRGSFVTHLLRAGVPLYIARDLAGHANISTTLGYTKVFDEDRKRGIRKLKFR